MPQISVIVPVFNTEKYLKECLDSILCQSFLDFELILVDDGSTDSSGIICDEYAKNNNRIRVFHQVNKGQAAARNFAVQESKGDWVAFVDSDDVIHPQYLERLYKCIDSDVNICCCNVFENEHTPDYSVVSMDKMAAKYKVDESFLMSEMADGYIGQIVCAKIIRKKIVKEIPFKEGRVFEDNAVMKKWLYIAKFISFVDEALYFYRINNSGTSKGSFDINKVKDVLWSRDEIIEFFKENGLNTAYELAERNYILFAINLYFRLNKVDKENAKNLKRDILKRFDDDQSLIFFSDDDKRFVYELKHPRLMWLYWKIKGII